MAIFNPKNQKKIIIIGIIFLVLLGIAIFLSIRNHQKKSTDSNQTSLTPVSTEPMLFPSLSTNGTKIFFYSANRDLAFYEQNIDGAGLKKISQNMEQPDAVIWSPDQKSAILKVTYNQRVFENFNSPFLLPGATDHAETTWLYNFTNQKLTHLSNTTGNVIWQTNDRIIYQEKNNASSLNSADANGQNAQKIVDLPNGQNYGLSFSSDNQLVIYNAPTDVSATTIYTLNLTDKKLTEIKKTDLPSNARGLTNGKILISTQNKKSHTLSLTNTDGSGGKNLNLNTTLDNLINLSSDQAITTASENSKFVFINTQTGATLVIKDASADKIQAQDLMVSPDKKTLYFTSNNLLYQLTLP